jgi:hypothetical protein
MLRRTQHSPQHLHFLALTWRKVVTESRGGQILLPWENNAAVRSVRRLEVGGCCLVGCDVIKPARYYTASEDRAQ